MASAQTLPEQRTEPAALESRALIRVQDVFVEYGQPGNPAKRILNNISLDIQPGEFISIVGQTGCGKSTLLRLVLAEEMPAGGQVLVEGSPRKQPDRRCGYVPQKYSLFPDRTVIENITFGLEVTEIGILGGFSPAKRVRRKRIPLRGDQLFAPYGFAGIGRNQISAPAFRRHAAARSHRASAYHAAQNPFDG